MRFKKASVYFLVFMSSVGSAFATEWEIAVTYRDPFPSLLASKGLNDASLSTDCQDLMIASSREECENKKVELDILVGLIVPDKKSESIRGNSQIFTDQNIKQKLVDLMQAFKQPDHTTKNTFKFHSTSDCYSRLEYLGILAGATVVGTGVILATDSYVLGGVTAGGLNAFFQGLIRSSNVGSYAAMFLQPYKTFELNPDVTVTADKGELCELSVTMDCGWNFGYTYGLRLDQKGCADNFKVGSTSSPNISPDGTYKIDINIERLNQDWK